MRGPLLSLAFGALLLVSPATSWAQGPASATVQAREAYMKGEELSAERRYAEAARAFALADELAPNDTALEAALEAALRGDDAAFAMNLLERTRRSPAARGLPVVARVEGTFGSRVGVIDLPCVEAVPACAATIDDLAPPRRRTFVAPGSHRVVLRQADGKAEQVSEVAVVAGGAVEVSLPPVASRPAPGGTAPTAPAPVDDTDDGGLSPWWFAGASGVTALLGGLTIGHGLAAAANKGEFDDASAAGAPRAELETLADQGRSLETRTNVFLVTTLVAGAATAGLAIFAVDWSDDAEARAFVVPAADGGRVVASGSF